MANEQDCEGPGMGREDQKQISNQYGHELWAKCDGPTDDLQFFVERDRGFPWLRVERADIPRLLAVLRAAGHVPGFDAGAVVLEAIAAEFTTGETVPAHLAGIQRAVRELQRKAGLVDSLGSAQEQCLDAFAEIFGMEREGLRLDDVVTEARGFVNGAKNVRAERDRLLNQGTALLPVLSFLRDAAPLVGRRGDETSLDLVLGDLQRMKDSLENVRAQNAGLRDEIERRRADVAAAFTMPTPEAAPLSERKAWAATEGAAYALGQRVADLQSNVTRLSQRVNAVEGTFETVAGAGEAIRNDMRQVDGRCDANAKLAYDHNVRLDRLHEWVGQLQTRVPNMDAALQRTADRVSGLAQDVQANFDGLSDRLVTVNRRVDELTQATTQRIDAVEGGALYLSPVTHLAEVIDGFQTTLASLQEHVQRIDARVTEPAVVASDFATKDFVDQAIRRLNGALREHFAKALTQAIRAAAPGPGLVQRVRDAFLPPPPRHVNGARPEAAIDPERAASLGTAAAQALVEGRR